jgi:hypothetical protein
MSKTLFLSKTDYKTARECTSKLYYRTLKYKSNKEGDEYMELLAKGGYMIGSIAGLLFPGAVPVYESDNDTAIQITKELMQNQDIILLEAAFMSEGKFARPDVLIKSKQNRSILQIRPPFEIKKVQSNQNRSHIWKMLPSRHSF